MGRYGKKETVVEALDKIGKADPAKAEKLKTAVKKALEGMDV